MPLSAVNHRRRRCHASSLPLSVDGGFLEGLFDGLLEGLKIWVAGGKGFVFYNMGNLLGLFDGLSSSGWFRLGF